MQRGEVWWAELPPPSGRRPVVLLTGNAALDVRTSVTIATITRTIRTIASRVTLGPEDGLPSRCAVNLDDVNTVPKSALTERTTMLSPEKLAAVTQAVVFALDLRFRY